MSDHEDQGSNVDGQDKAKRGISPEEAERMLQRVGAARRRLVCQGRNGTTFSPVKTDDPLLDVGQELLIDCQPKEDEENTEN